MLTKRPYCKILKIPAKRKASKKLETGSVRATIAGVTVPGKGNVPVATVTETAQYTGTITWSPTDNPFAGSTIYTATITLTPKTGYTLTGVSANFFTVVGTLTPATNAANSGVITAVFPATDL
jgi:hypothetical protein